MADPDVPSEAPPTYAQATGSSSADASGRLQPRNNIPVHARRSMEDENRPLPTGWVRQFDAKHAHQYFVDTRADPPRSIWHHPYDDDDYLNSVSPEERRKIEGAKRTPNRRDTETWSTDGSEPNSPIDKKQGGLFSDRKTKPGRVDEHAGEGSSAQAAQQQQQDEGKPKLGRRLKDKLTGTTHDQRVAEREQRAREEEEQYEHYLAMRTAMSRAYQTGEPQLLGKDRDGKEVYVEPPMGYGSRGAYGSNVYVNPYTQGPYANPNARFVRPAGPYSRPYGGGYGGGYGLPIAGGLAGGLLLGGLLGGFGA